MFYWKQSFNDKELKIKKLVKKVLIAGTLATFGLANAQNINLNNIDIEAQYEQDVVALINVYQDILNDGKPENLSKVYTEEAMFIGQNFPTAEGLDNITALYSDFLSKLDFNVDFDIKEIQLDKNIGYVRTISTGSITPKGQKAAVNEANREIFTVNKIEGEWK